MQLWPFLEEKLIKVDRPFLSVTGGGGKTTFLVEFGSYLKRRGKKVLLTTTTKMGPPEMTDYKVDHFFPSLSSFSPVSLKDGETVLFARRDENGAKLYYPGKDEIEYVSSFFDVVLCEADGSRQRPLKVHTSRDPVVLSQTTGVVSIVGIWGVGERTAEVVFGDDDDRVVDREYLKNFLLSSEGPLKGMRDDTLNIILFNGGDVMTEEQRNMVLSLQLPDNVSAYIVSERKGVIYDAV